MDARMPAFRTRAFGTVLVAGALLVAMPARAERSAAPLEDETTAGCAGTALCALPGVIEEPFDEKRAVLHLLALLPFGGWWGPRWLLEKTPLPPVKGGLRRTIILHSVVPGCCVLAIPPTGLCLFPPVGALCGTIAGPCILGAIVAVIGFFVIPVGGTILGFLGGAGVGLVVGAAAGIVAGFLGGTLGLCLLGCPPLAAWQAWLGPNTMIRAWDRAARLQRENEANERPRNDGLAEDVHEPGSAR